VLVKGKGANLPASEVEVVSQQWQWSFRLPGADGRLGPATSAAYAKYQKSKGEVADGFVTLDAYEELAGGK